METEDVGTLDQLFGIHDGDAQSRRRRFVERGIGNEEAEPGGAQPFEHGPADLAETEETDHRLAIGEERLGDSNSGPAAGADTLVKRQDLAQLGEYQRHGVVGDFVDAVVGNIAHRNAPGVGGGDIDVVEADAVTEDCCAFGENVYGAGCEWRELDDGEIGAADGVGHFVGALALEGDEIGACLCCRCLLGGELREGVVGNDDAA
jgi:hypothetical protein